VIGLKPFKIWVVIVLPAPPLFSLSSLSLCVSLYAFPYRALTYLARCAFSQGVLDLKYRNLREM